MNLVRAFAITKSRILRGPAHVVGAVLVMSASFFVVTVFTFIFMQSKLALNYLESVPQVTAFLTDTASQSDINSLMGKIQNSGMSSSVKFVSREQGLADYKRENADKPQLTQLVTADYIPPSIQVQATKLDNLGKIADIFNGEKGKSVDYVVYFSDVVQNLSRFTEGIQNTSLILLGLLLISLTITSAFITGLQTYVNRDEIEIMRLIGASKSYIYLPFVLEALLYGIVSSLLASAVAMGAVPFILTWFSDLFKGVHLGTNYYVTIVGVSLVIGIVTNLIGSLIAVRRYARL
jgi:cell division transport system permease protein